MPVDLSKVSRKYKDLGDIRFEDAGVRCLERVALRKSWSKKPTYWLMILEDANRGVIQAFRAWKWSGGDGLKQGQTPIGPAVYRKQGTDPVKHYFLDMLTTMLRDRDYCIQESQTTGGSFINAADYHNAKSNAPAKKKAAKAMKLPPMENPEPVKKHKPEPIKRKAEKDWW